MKTFFLKTFGCQQNVADSERIASYYDAKGMTQVESVDDADLVVINTCMIREKAEERVYGYIRNLRKVKDASQQHIIMTGCITGAAMREPSGTLAKKLQKRVPDVELMPIEDVGFENEPKRTDPEKKHAWVIISNGCNNFCAFCIVPFSRGTEASRPFADVMGEVQKLADEGYTSVTLLGQNVNSYGTDLVLAKKKEEQQFYELADGTKVEPVFVTHLGRHRIPTLFPYLLEAVAQTPGIDTVTFTSSNPWDFSDALIDVIARNHNIDRLLHLPVQSGSDKILKRMNRWYTHDSYLALITKMRARIDGMQLITDIIVGFPGETEEDFQESIRLSQEAGFARAFISCYSPRPGTAATKGMDDALSWEEKKERWHRLNDVINKPNRGVSYSKDWIRTGKRKINKKFPVRL